MVIELSACAFHLPPGSERDAYWRGLEAAAETLGCPAEAIVRPMRLLISDLLQLPSLDNVDFAVCGGLEPH